MDLRAGKALADYLEPRMEAFGDLCLGRMSPADPELARTFMLPWIQRLPDFLRGRSHRAQEWAVLLLDGVTASGRGVEEAMGYLRQFRGALFSFTLDRVPGVSAAELYALVLEVCDQHQEQVIACFGARAREMLNTAARRQRSMLDALSRPFLLLDGRGFVTAGNNEAAVRLRVSPENLPGLDFVGACPPETAQEFRRCLRQRRTVLQGESFSGPLSAGPEEGPRMQFHVQPVFDGTGRKEGLAVCMEPPESFAADNRYILDHIIRRIVDIIPLPIQVFDKKRRILHSTEFCEGTGLFDAGRQRPFCCHFNAAQGNPPEECVCARVLAAGAPHACEARLDAGGESRWFNMAVLPIMDAAGETSWAACGILETTSQKRLEKRMENQMLSHQHGSLVSQIALTVAHQLRNPLGVVIGFSELLSRGLPAEQVPEVVDRILRNGLRCKEIVDELLNFGHGLPQDRAPSDVAGLLRTSIRPMLTGAQNRMLQWRLPGGPVMVECVPEQFTQVVLGLLDNAFCFARAAVECSLESAQGWVTVRVADDGPGIPDELADQVFEPFFTTRRAGGAAGLGLSLARSVVRDWGGDISLCRGPGGGLPGACFEIRLPEAGEEPPAEPVAEKAPERKKRVLLVDDNPDLLDMLETALTLQGHMVDRTDSGVEALDKTRELAYDALVIDIYMPGSMNGRELFQRLRAQIPGVSRKVLFITGDTLNYETQRFLQTEGVSYLEKPFLMQDFQEALGRVLQFAD